MIKIRIPATSANIGSGFDSLGLAVDLYNYVNMEENDHIHITSLDDIDVPKGEENLIYKTAKHVYELCGKKLNGLTIEQSNNIPMARGLGSSSACIVAGLVGANRLLNNPLTTDDIVNLAAVMEGHPDNSTPAILGGLVTAVLEKDKVYYVKQEIKGNLKFAAFIPDFELKTELARASLPTEIAHKDGVYNLSRSALMSVSLYTGKYENLRIAAQDKLHQPYRLSLINHAEDTFNLAYDLGAYAAYISGAGSTLMALVDSENKEFELKARLALDQLGLSNWRLLMLDIDKKGTIITE